MPPPPAPLSSAGLRRDLSLVAQHLHTLPHLLGNPSWHARDKRGYLRPRSELDATFFAAEQARIAAAAVVTFPLFVIGFVALAVGLAVEAVSGGCRVLDAVLSVFGRVLGWAAGRGGVKSEGRVKVCVLEKEEGKEAEEEVCYFVNGVVEQGRMVEANAEVLEELTGRAFNLFLNPSDGLWLDLIECMFGRTLDVASPVVSKLVDELEAQLVEKRRRVVLVAHSQGGIIQSNVLSALLQRAGDPGGGALQAALALLEVYSFCSAADEFAGKGVVFAEHFAAEFDFVSRVGVLHFSGKLAELEGEPPPPAADEWNGEVFVYPRAEPGQGHLLKEMVLPVLVKGPFGRSSRFYTRYFRASDGFRKVSHVVVENDDSVL